MLLSGHRHPGLADGATGPFTIALVAQGIPGGRAAFLPPVQPLRIVIVSTPVGPLGSGVGGGVELTLHSLVYGLSGLGHSVEVVAPAGSLHVGARVHQIEGVLQPSSQLADRAAPVELPTGSVLAAMWQRIADLQDDIDVVVNLGYDWLPLYLTSFLAVPVVHFISMGSLNDAMDAAIHDLARRHPDRLGAHTARRP